MNGLQHLTEIAVEAEAVVDVGRNVRITHRDRGRFAPSNPGFHEDHDHPEAGISGPHRHYAHSASHSHSADPGSAHDHHHSHAFPSDILHGGSPVHLPSMIHTDHEHPEAVAQEHPGHGSQKVHGGGKGPPQSSGASPFGGGVGGRMSTTGDKGSAEAGKRDAEGLQGRANASMSARLSPEYGEGVKHMKEGDRNHKIGDYAAAKDSYDRAGESFHQAAQSGMRGKRRR